MHDQRRRRPRVGGPEPVEREFVTRRPSHNGSPDPAETGQPEIAGATQAEGLIRAAAAEIGRLTAELEATQAEASELLNALQRERAEFQNFRRRTTEERERTAGLAGDYLLKKVLAIADDLDRAIEALPGDLIGHPWAEGIAAIDRKLRGLLESEGVRPIEAVGKPFDPREHEAISSVQASGRPDGEVVAEVQRGYRVRDRILRPALVMVAAGGTDEPSDEASSRPGTTHHQRHPQAKPLNQD